MAFLNRVTGWESVPQLHYVEWHYGAPNTDFDFSDGGRWPPKSLDQKMAAHTQNGAMLMGLSDMAAGITPTGYQHSVIPPFARAKTLVQFDGTDTDFFSPDASGEKKSVSVPSNWTSVFARANGGMTECWYPVGVMPAAMSLRPISIAPFCVCAAIFWSSDFGGHRPPSEKSKSVFGAP